MTRSSALQRTLFRMQLDPLFAGRVRAGEARALDSTGLDEVDQRLVRALDPIALSADREGRRSSQLLGNLATEFPRTCALLTSGSQDPAALEPFLRHELFHETIALERSLPLAFAAWVGQQDKRGAAFEALAALEREMAIGRRGLRALPRLSPGEFALAATCRLLDLPDGSLALASAEDPSAADAPLDSATREVLLIQSSARPLASGRREVTVERLEPAVAGLLTRLQVPARLEQLADYAASLGASSAELEGFAEELAADRILLRAQPDQESARERESGLADQ